MADVLTVQNALKGLLEAITPLRQRAAELQEGLAKVELDYKSRLRELNDKREELQRLKDALEAQPAPKPDKPPEPEPPKEEDPPVEPPPPLPILDTPDDEAMPTPQPATRDERQERKLEIADHIESLLSYDAWAAVMQDVNAILADPERDVGDMLELVPWGDFWTQKAEWETPNEQLVRLAGWQEAMEGRLTYWRNKLRSLEAEDHYLLWRQMQQLSRQEWLDLLENMAHMQERENDELERQIAVLQRHVEMRRRAVEARDG